MINLYLKNYISSCPWKLQTALHIMSKFLHWTSALRWGWNFTPFLLSSLKMPDDCFRALTLVSHRSRSPWLRGQCLEPKAQEESGSSRCQNTCQLSLLFLLLQHSRLDWLHPLLETDRGKNGYVRIQVTKTTDRYLSRCKCVVGSFVWSLLWCVSSITGYWA